jgi:hypothetical protein
MGLWYYIYVFVSALITLNHLVWISCHPIFVFFCFPTISNTAWQLCKYVRLEWRSWNCIWWKILGLMLGKFIVIWVSTWWQLFTKLESFLLVLAPQYGLKLSQNFLLTVCKWWLRNTTHVSFRCNLNEQLYHLHHCHPTCVSDRQVLTSVNGNH